MPEALDSPSPSSGPTAPLLSIVVPTYCEAVNIPGLVERVEAVKHSNGLDLELIVMDDNSPDGTPEVVDSLGKDWVHLVVRTEDRGLSQSVVDGFKRAQGEYILVMDADLSHPPEKIPELLDAVRNGADMAVGSRYVSGGSTDAAWTLFRRINSGVATAMAAGLTRMKDPMSGFFCFRRSILKQAPWLNPIGYKILLEVLVKCRCKSVKEVPIHFMDREKGTSKLSLKEQLKYLQHLRRLYQFKYQTLYHFFEFAVIGSSGAVVNLALLTVFLYLGLGFHTALVLAIAGSMLTNFLLNRRLTFSYARGGGFFRHLLGFCAACSLGAVVNYATASVVHRSFPELLPQIAAAFGIAAGTILNFLLNRYVVFKKKVRRPEAPSAAPNNE